jgi:hypothetical protein
MVSDGKRMCGLMCNTIIQLLKTMIKPFNAAKDSFDVLCSNASIKVSASPLSFSSNLCVTKTAPQLLKFQTFVAKHRVLPLETFLQIFFQKAHLGELILVLNNVKFYFL